MLIRDFFVYMNKNKSAQFCLSVACIATYFITNKNNIPTLKYNDFEISADFIKSLILLLGLYYCVYFIISLLYILYKHHLKTKTLKILRNITNEERAFFYDRLYRHKNEKNFCVKQDEYFYPREYDDPENQRECYHFETEEDIGIFIRTLEKKGLLKEKDEKEMAIADIVWDTLKENDEKIFKGYGFFFIREK